MFWIVLNACNRARHVMCPAHLKQPIQAATKRKGVNHEEESVPSGPRS